MSLSDLVGRTTSTSAISDSAFEHAPRLIAQSRLPATRRQGLPQHVAQDLRQRAARETIHLVHAAFQRQERHEIWGLRPCVLLLELRKWQCRDCGRHFRQRRGLQRQFSAWHSGRCPPVLGIDEHFFTRRQGYATTLCDLRHHKVYDVVLGRSEAALEAYFQRLEGKAEVRVVCMDLSNSYRALVRKHFPNARIVADRFHVIRLINHHFLACWRELDPVGSKNRGLLSLMRRHRHKLTPHQQTRLLVYLAHHPALELIFAPGRPDAVGLPRRNLALLVGRDRHHVALHPQ